MGYVEFLNKNGGKMLVDESRVEEYKAAGHKPAAEISAPKEPIIKAPSVSKKRTKKNEV